MKIRKTIAAAALGSLTATGALLTGMSDAAAQGAPGAGSFPNSFLIPGTQTSLRVGGFVQMIYAYDFGVCAPGNPGVDPAFVGTDPGSPLDAGGILHNHAQTGHAIHGCGGFTAQTSRLQFETRTPSAYGEIKTFLSGDFQDPNGLSHSGSFKRNSNSAGFRLREAYGTLGPFLAGQTISNFRDASVEAETIDNGGPFATSTSRVPQVRYTFDFGNGLTLGVAAEASLTTIVRASIDTVPFGSTKTTYGVGLGEKIPDFTAKLNYAAPWGHVNVTAVARDLYWHDGGHGGPLGTEGQGNHTSKFGWAVGVAGAWNLPWFKDTLAGAFRYGDGAGRYVGGNGFGGFSGDAVLDTSTQGSTLHTIKQWDIQGNYTHNWTDTLRSNLVFAYARKTNKSSDFTGFAAFQNQAKYGWWGGVNLFWSPVPQVDLGVEYAYSRGQLQSGQRGDQNAVNLVATFRF